MRRRQSIHHRVVAVISAGLLLAAVAPAALAAEPRPDREGLRALPEMIQVGDRHGGDTSTKIRPQGSARLVPIVIKLDLVPLASYDGGVQGLAPTQDLVAERRTDASAQAAIGSYERHAATVQGAFERRLASAVPRAQIIHRLTWVIGGVSASVPIDRLAEISRLPGVVSVMRDTLEQVDTEASPEFIGAPTTWSRLGGQRNAGQGVIVGILDTGIWPEHDSFSDPDPAGKAYASPPPAPDGDRACEFGIGGNPGDPFTCNDKLIGADRFMDTYDAFGPPLLPGEFTDPRDDDGHGTHTASTAAGNRQVEAVLLGVNRGLVSGIAPRAHVMAYKVCGDAGCYSSDSAAAVQEAIQDGVDVINFSISGGGNPYSDAVSLAFLDAYAAGVFVAASAGNSGPGPDTVAHREPWTTTVAASTSDRHFLSTVTMSSSTAADVEFVGATVTAGLATTDVVYAGDAPYNDPLCLDDTADGAFAGLVVICDRGSIARVAKGFNVLQRGAAGMLLLNKSLLGLATDNHWLPAVHLEVDVGDQLLAYFEDNSDVQASWTQGVATEVDGDDMAGFSSRGGPDQSLGISKPDVTAPGVQILAGQTPEPATTDTGPSGQFFQAIAGTSMSSPHVAGAAALLADLKPGWNPGQIKSALMTTGFQKVFKEDSVTRTDPFDDGSGRIDLRKAHEPGITFSAFAPQFFLNQHDLSRVNYPSVYVPDMPGRFNVKRTARNELSGTRVWTITTNSPADFQIDTPSAITIAGGGQAVFKIALDASAVPLGEVRHGEILLKSGSYKARMPVTIVRGQGGAVAVDKECKPTTLAKKTNTTCTIDVTNTSFDSAEVTIKDRLPDELKIRPTTITGATLAENGVFHNTTLDGAEPADVTVDPGTFDGYFDISDPAFGSLALGLDDEDIVNVSFGEFSTFEFAGEVWDTLGIVSNGYGVVGGGTGSDVVFSNFSELPDPDRPNNVLAPYWTDLDPSKGGEVYVNVLGTGPNCDAPNHCWLVVEWQDVPEFSNPTTTSHTFQIWLGLSGDASPGQDITFEYDTQTGIGDGGILTVGAENKFGNRGETVYFNGEPAANLPADGDQWVVNSTPGQPGETHTITFQAKGVQVGEWTNCALVRGSTFSGRATDCVSGEVTPALAP